MKIGEGESEREIYNLVREEEWSLTLEGAATLRYLSLSLWDDNGNKM